MAGYEYPPRRLTVEEYHEMMRAGILKDGDPIELLEGWLVIKERKTPGHSFSTYVTREALAGVGLWAGM
jgi:hypothetical protein